MAPATPTTLSDMLTRKAKLITVSDILDACEDKKFVAYVLDHDGAQSRVMAADGKPMRFGSPEQAKAHCETLDVKDYQIYSRMVLRKPEGEFELTDEELDHLAKNGVEVDA